jgi:long-chain fatty acid transport protein
MRLSLPGFIPTCLAFGVIASVPASEGTLAVATGPAQLGAAGNGSASPQDSTWLSMNPATLVGMADRIDVGSEMAWARQTLEPAGALGNASAGRMSDRETVILPYATVVGHRGDDTLALGVYTVGGLTVDFPHARSLPGAFQGDVDRRGQLYEYRAALAYGRSIAGWNVAVALNLDYQQFRSDGVTATGAETTGDYRRDSASGAGFQVGVFRRWNDIAVDVGYTSRQWMKRLDDYRDLFSSSLDEPQIVRAGIAWRVLPWLEPVLDYHFIDWKDIDAYGSDLGWKNQHVVGVGVNAHVHPEVTLRAGVSYGNSPIDEGHVFLNGVSPLIATTHAGIGADWRPTDRFDLGVALMHTFKRTLTDDGSDVGGAGQGTKVSFVLSSVSVDLGYVF